MSILSKSHGNAYRAHWPTGPVQGRFLIQTNLLVATEKALRTFRGPEGPHEGIVFWGGRELEGFTLYTTAVIPHARHTKGSVQCDEAAMREVVRALRPHGLGLLAQIHSHPGGDARHSYGDDEMVLLPFEGMLSIVVPSYGRDGLYPLSTCGIHQFQQGRWVLCESNLENIQVVPGSVDVR